MSLEPDLLRLLKRLKLGSMVSRLPDRLALVATTAKGGSMPVAITGSYPPAIDPPSAFVFLSPARGLHPAPRTDGGETFHSRPVRCQPATERLDPMWL